MVEKIGFWRRFCKVMKAILNFIFIYFFFLIVLITSVYVILGFIIFLYNENLDEIIEFSKYLTALTFSLAGFTFLGSTLIKKCNERITRGELDILNVFWMFILSGFFGIAFIGLSYLEPTFLERPISHFILIKEFLYPTTIMLSLIFFFVGLMDFMINLRIKIPILNEKFKKKRKKKPWKEFLKKIAGFD